MNIRTKLLAGLLAVAMLFSLMPVGVLASEPQPADRSGSAQLPFQVNPLYEGVVDADAYAHSETLKSSRDAQKLASAIYVTEEEAVEQARDYMKSRTGTFDIYVVSSSFDYQKLINQIIASALVHTGGPKEGDYLMWQYGGHSGEVYWGYNNGQYEFWFTIDVIYYTTKDQEAAMDVAVDQVLNYLALSGKSDYEKVCAVYDYVCKNVTYDYANLNNDANVLKYTAYGALIDGTAVCQGYALLMYRLLLELGVDTRVIAGRSGGEDHAWNIVKLGDVYYNLDSTWDAGREQYSYFLRSGMNFGDHTRSLEYASREFHVQYPMSATDYVDGVAGEPASVYAWGDCGDNAHWTLDMDGTLTIFGEGATYDYTDYGTLEEMSPWTYWMDDISTLEVEEGITYLGEHTFSYMDTLTSVTLPDTLTQIGENAFAYCTGLTEIAIPAGVAALDAACFRDCSALADIYFEGDAPDIDPAAFTNVTANAHYPEDNATWTSGVMTNCGGNITWIPTEYTEPEEPSEPEEPETPSEPEEPETPSEPEDTLGTFNGSEACVKDGKLHLCEINFPDKYFRSYIAEEDTDADGYLSAEEVNSVTTIDYSRGHIISMKGVEFFTSLEELVCHNNLLKTLDVSRNTALVRLECYSNNLTALDLSKNTALEYLDCSDNDLESLDLSKNTALEYLVCDSNDLTALDLSKNTALVSLDCHWNDLDTLDLSKNTALEYLDCYACGLGALDLSKNTALEYLVCDSNDLTALDVSKNTALVHLECGYNDLVALDVSKNTALEILWCGDNGLTSLDVSKNTALVGLNCDNNPLTILDVSKNTVLTGLSCEDIGLTSLDVSKNTVLERLSCGGNNLTTLDVSKNTALRSLDCIGSQISILNIGDNIVLTELDCSDNNLDSLDVSKNTSLYWMDCRGNSLTGLDVSKNTALRYLYCSDNSLTSLDVSKNTALEVLSCSNNNLTALDVSKNTALEMLWCNENGLTSLDVSQNAVLGELECGNNALTSLDVSKNTSLYWLDCSGNSLSVLDLSNIGGLWYENVENQQLLQVSYREGTYQLSLAELVGSENLGNIISVTATDLAGNVRELTMAADGTVTCDADTYYVEYLYDTGCPSLDATMNVGMYMIPDVTFVGASLSLKGDIGLNYYAALSQRILSDSTAYMNFTGSGADRQVAISKGIYDASDGSYRYSVALNAKNMGDDVTAQVYNAGGAVGEGKTLSIKYYADYVINNSSKEVFVNLMKAMLNYGAAAQTNFGYDVENLVNADMSEADRALPETLDVAKYAHTWSGEEAGIEVTSASLLLQSETKIRIYFKLAEGKTLNDFAFTVNGETVTPVQSGEEYYIEKTNVAAKDLDTMYTFRLGNRQLTYCGLSYVNQVLNYSKDEKLLNLVKSLYCYNQAANAYFGA